MIAMVLSRTAIGMVAAIPLLGLSAPLHAKDFIGPEPSRSSARYSQAIGRQDRMARRTDRDGRRFRQVIGRRLRGTDAADLQAAQCHPRKSGRQAGDMVQMTVFITDVRYGDRLTRFVGRYSAIFPAALSSPSPAWPIPTPRSRSGLAVIGSSGGSESMIPVVSFRRSHAHPSTPRQLSSFSPSSVSIVTACSGGGDPASGARRARELCRRAFARAADEGAGMAHALLDRRVAAHHHGHHRFGKIAHGVGRHIPCRRRSRRNKAPGSARIVGERVEIFDAGCARPPYRRRWATTLWPIPARVSCRAMASVSCMPLRVITASRPAVQTRRNRPRSPRPGTNIPSVGPISQRPRPHWRAAASSASYTGTYSATATMVRMRAAAQAAWRRARLPPGCRAPRRSAVRGDRRRGRTAAVRPCLHRHAQAPRRR